MDELDLAILREAGRDMATGWGNRDPRVSTNELARRLGVPRSTVGARLRAWRSTGFLQDYELMLNPVLLDTEIFGVLFHVPDAGQRDKIPGDLALMDHCFAYVEHLDGWFMAAFYGTTTGSRERTTGLVGRLEGVGWASPPMTCALPRCTITLQARDLRLIEAIRRDPLQTLKAAAQRLGVDERTVRRRYKRLLDAQAVWFVPSLDFTRWTGGAILFFAVSLDAQADVASCHRSVQQLLPEHMRVNEVQEEAIAAQDRFLEYLVHMENPARAEALVRKIRAVPGIAQVQPLLPLRTRTFPHWLDEQTAARTGGSKPERTQAPETVALPSGKPRARRN